MRAGQGFKEKFPRESKNRSALIGMAGSDEKARIKTTRQKKLLRRRWQMLTTADFSQQGQVR